MSGPLVNLARGRPVLAVFEATLRCNSACRYCDLPLNEGRYELGREEIARIFRHLHGEGLRFVLVQGGEPLVRRDLPEILEDLVEIGMRPTLVTNGTRLTRGLVARLARLPLGISVSLDSLDRGRYAAIRGADQLRRVLAGIDALAEFPGPRFITCIVSDANRDDVLDVVRFARERGFVPVVGAYHWDVGRYGKDDREIRYERTAALAVFEAVLDSGLVPPGYFRGYLRDNLRWLRGERLARCDAGRWSIAIDASGNVAPCLALAHAGNLRETTLPEILARLDRDAIARCSAASSCNLMCSRVVGSLVRNPLAGILASARPAPAATA